MKVLVACEFSQIVTRAFRDKGHEAYSCDIIPTEGNPVWHIQDDVLKHLNDGWDMMIAHPPCTYLTYAGTRFWNEPQRYKKRLTAIIFFMEFVDARIERICIENPFGIMEQIYRPSDQEIHPYYWGDSNLKRTCLWLKNLPKLTYQLQDDLFSLATACTKPEPLSIDSTPKHHKRYFTDSKIRDSFLRAKTFDGIANAMADQWGELI